MHDHYVHSAQKDGYRARAAYKLLEINERDKLLTPGAVVVDLGAAPGSWSQVAAKLVGSSGQVLALDMLPMEPLAGVEFIQGDFREQVVLDELIKCLKGRAVDLVISDMAPNISGMSVIDQARSYHLAELALDFATQYLRPGGNFLVKVFQGSDFQLYLAAMKDSFAEVLSRKPKASRDRSQEIYLIGKRRR